MQTENLKIFDIRSSSSRIRIRCTIVWIRNTIFNPNIVGRLEKTFTDVKIRVGEEEFPVHRCVLSSFSPYFRAMFTAGLGNQ